VMMSARDRYFGFRLEAQRYSRITQFFDGVDVQHYKGALRYLRDELNRVRGWLKQARLQDRFQPKTLGDNEYQATFPFVEMAGECAAKAIKPLHLGQDRSARIIDRGGAWAFRIEQLRKRGKLPP